METYARHLIVECWPRTPDEDNPPLRPVASVHTLRDAVHEADLRNQQAVVDGMAARGLRFQVWDLEHLHLGDMLTAEDSAATVARFREAVEAAEAAA